MSSFCTKERPGIEIPGLRMVAGAGFEPAIPPQRRDYDPDESTGLLHPAIKFLPKENARPWWSGV